MVPVVQGTVDPRDNSLGDAARQRGTAGVSDGDDPLADLQRVGVPEFGRHQIFRLDFDDREVGFRINTDQLCRIGFIVVQLDIDAGCAFHHMGVRNDVAVRVDDDSGALPGRGEGIKRTVLGDSDNRGTNPFGDFHR